MPIKGMKKIIASYIQRPTTGVQREIPTHKIGKEVYIYKIILRTDILQNLQSPDIEILDKKISNIYKSGGKWKEKLQGLKEIREEYEQILKKYNQELEELFKDYNIQTNILPGKQNNKGSIERFNSVTELYLYNNKNLTELPQRIQKFPKLNYLSIGNAPNLTKIPQWIKKTPIKKLDLIQTGITRFPQALYAMQLQRLDIRGTNIKIPQNESEKYHLTSFLRKIKEQGELYMGEINETNNK